MNRAVIGLVAAEMLHGADVRGIYRLRGVREMASQLELLANGTFKYAVIYGALDYYVEGTWRHEGDAVFLTSKTTDAEPVRFVRGTASKTDGIKVWVKNTHRQPIPHMEIGLLAETGAVMQRTDRDGLAHFADSARPKYIEIRIPVYDLVAGPFELKPDHNELHFEISPEAVTQPKFRNERLQLKEAILQLRFFDPDRPLNYHKQ